MKHSRIVFCDFDGTITTQDTFVNVLEKFIPEIAAIKLPAIFRREITLRQGIHQTLGSIPSVQYPEIINYLTLSRLKRVRFFYSTVKSRRFTPHP